ncbi:MAG: hypothetical protein N3A69_14785, partial [Leptospiraceae bacterium]|nr:hypothetical protein [Leptospiraceae bacterium]
HCSPLPQNFKLYCLNLSEGNYYISYTCSGFYDKKACILNRTVGELKYQYRDWSLSMEAGAIFSKYSQENYSKLLYEPRILLNTTAGTSKYLVITIPVFDGNISAAGYGRFRFTIEETNWSYSRIENVNNASIKRRFENIYIIIKETEHKNSWCEFFGNFDIFNLTLPEIGRNCKNAKNPSVIIERGDEKLETIFLFKEVVLYG